MSLYSLSGRTCKICGCTDNDCRLCIEKTGEPCYWIAKDLCSACEEFIDSEKVSVKVEFSDRLGKGHIATFTTWTNPGKEEIELQAIAAKQLDAAGFKDTVIDDIKFEYL